VSEADDYLAHLVRHVFTAGDVAQHDQQMASARNYAAQLLSAYMTFHSAMDGDNLGAASHFHDQFTDTFRHMNRDDGYLVITTLCDWVSHQLLAQHGDSWSRLAEAVSRGDLFPRNMAIVNHEEVSLFKRLEEEINDPHGQPQ
jgi:hypothetical protein